MDRTNFAVIRLVVFGMGAKQNHGPIFVIGSPRSGTSILTWCLGQHANILHQEESGWLGEFAINVGVQFRRGSEHGQRSQLPALGVDFATFFRTFGNSINALVLAHRLSQEQVSRKCSKYDPSQINSVLNLSRSCDEPKSRWVDGTPEYSYYTAGLRKLFPDAKFIHIVRDVRAVVDSMLNFRMSNGRKLVETEQQAYEYWLGTVDACVQAERAYGPKVVHRLRYDDLVRRPESAIREVLEFLNEPYMEVCLHPLASKINSSCVHADFDAHDPKTDITVVNRALQLSDQLQQDNFCLQVSDAVCKQLEEDFGKRVAFVSGLDAAYADGQKKVATLTMRLNWCGVALTMNFLIATIVFFAESLAKGAIRPLTSIFWLISSTAGVGFYITTRRAGVRNSILKLLRRCGLLSTAEFRWASTEQVEPAPTHDLGMRKM